MELVLPNNYVEIEEEEMMYLDGGAYLSKAKCKNLVASIGMNPYSFIAAALTVTIATKIVKKAAKFGGFWGWCASAVVGWAGNQILTFARGIARGIAYNGVDIYWNWDWFASGIGYSVRY